MKLKHLFLGVVSALIFMPINNTFASAQDFYFTDFTADYYLTRLEDGTSNLHVKEILTAMFPESNQNHGITRTIPYTNQGGKNRTIANESALNLTVLRNGEPENISKIVADDGYYTVYIGNANTYVHGEQVYTLEYDYVDVITEFTEDGENVSGVDGVTKAFQELYWDANGTGWSQRFDKVTANLYVSEDVYKNMATDAWCYVGKYGASGKDRCTIVSTNDGFSFMANNLAAGENLTFVTEFKPDTFKVVLEKSYVLVVMLVAEISLFGVIIIWKVIRWRRKAKSQYDFYKATFVAPQYQAPDDANIHVAEGEQIYLKKTKSSYVATLLELVVSKKVTIRKVENQKKYDWQVQLNVEPDELSESQKEMMNILHGKSGVQKGDLMPIQKHTPTKYLSNCAKDYKADAVKALENGGYLLENKSNTKTLGVLLLILLIIFSPMILAFAVGALEGMLEDFGLLAGNAIIVGVNVIPTIMLVVFAIGVIVIAIYSRKTRKYEKYTEKGLKLARYLEGLELYIGMAEAERLNFLQSVEGADTSNEGIVKLYEELLPWASLFGLEESWMKELAKYYEIGDVDELISQDLVNGIIAANIVRDVDRVILQSTSYVEPSSAGGSWSSGGSGGGGGGFSGGGGGGGGGGGW